MSLLRILINNPRVVQELPHLRDDRKHKLPLGLMLRSQESFQRFIRELQAVLRTKNDRGELDWPKVSSLDVEIEIENRQKAPNVLLKPLNDVSNRWSVGPRIEDTSCARRQIGEVDASKYLVLLGIDIKSEEFNRQRVIVPDVTADAIRSFATQPLKQHIKVAAVVEFVSREEMRQQYAQRTGSSHENGSSIGGSGGEFSTIPHLAAVNSELPFALNDHRSAKTPLGKSTLSRLQAEMRAYSQQVGGKLRSEIMLVSHVYLF